MTLDSFEVLVILWLRHIDHRLGVIDHKLSVTGNSAALQLLTEQLHRSEQELKAALAPYLTQISPATPKGIAVNPILQALADQVTKTTTAEQSAITLINGIAGRIQAAVDAALAGGATASQLAPVQEEVDALKASSQALSDAIAANTPVQPQFKK